jgi:hypothetical protein
MPTGVHRKKIEVVMPLNYTFILDKRINMFLPVPTIGNTMELFSIRVSLQNKIALRALVPFKFLLME